MVTRHNAGFLVLDALAGGWELPPFRQDAKALVTEAEMGSDRLVLAKPLTFMNRSGEALPPFLASPDFQPARDFLAICDDFAIPLGTFRLRGAGSSGGHNGLQSIEQTLGTQDYARLRVGIGPLPAGDSSEWKNFVLSPFSPQELDSLSDLLPDLADAIECWALDGIETAMSKFNRRVAPGE